MNKNFLAIKNEISVFFDRHDEIVNVLLVVLTAILFALSHPSPIFLHGQSNFGFVFFVPFLFLVFQCDIKTSWFWGGLSGVFSYALYAHWLFAFNVFSAILVLCMYFFSYALVSFFLKLAENFFVGEAFFFALFFLLCVFEYTKTIGFAGFSYGVSGYTQWENEVLLQTASIFGVWFLTFTIDFFSVAIFVFLKDFFENKFLQNQKKHIAHFVIFFLTILFANIYGNVRLQKKEKAKNFVTVCAIQNNSDPWQGGISYYEKDVETILSLVKKAMNENPRIDIFVLPETAIVPSILQNYKMRTDRARFDLVKKILEFIENQSAVFVLGNFHATEAGDFNSSFVFVPKKNVIPPEPEMYHKIHLVPFTEDFPFAKKNAIVYNLAELLDAHVWERGTEYKVFHEKNISFATPICFEDTFGEDCRRFVKNGAEVFFNQSNDAWAKSETSLMQHLSMAVFRSVENNVPQVRSTASGLTCVIDERGKIVLQTKPFEENYVIGKIPRLENAGKTFYTKWGDTFAIVFILASASVLAFLLLKSLKKIEV